MRYLMALILMWGVVSFSSAQDDQTLQDCPPSDLKIKDADVTIQIQGSEMESDDAARLEEAPEGEAKVEYKDDQAEFEQELESDGEAEIEYEDDQIEYEYEIESDAALMDTSNQQQKDASAECPNGDGTSSETDVDVETETSSDAEYGTSTYETYEEYDATALEEQDQEHSTFGKIWRSPFKLIGNIPKAAVSIVSESAEGVGHVVGAPFKGVAKLFGAEEDDNDDMYNDGM